MSANIKDIRRDLHGRGQRLDRAAGGAVELSYMRGFQAGYEQAMADAKKKKMRAVYALQPHRAEPGGKT